jgi:hypothetical protein
MDWHCTIVTVLKRYVVFSFQEFADADDGIVVIGDAWAFMWVIKFTKLAMEFALVSRCKLIILLDFVGESMLSSWEILAVLIYFLRMLGRYVLLVVQVDLFVEAVLLFLDICG